MSCFGAANPEQQTENGSFFIWEGFMRFGVLIYQSAVATKDFWERRQLAPMVNLSKFLLSSVMHVVRTARNTRPA
jgi:hypothetical protein